MAGEWPIVTLSEVCETITDGAHFSPSSVDSGLPMASVKDMHRWGIDLSSCRLISHEDFESLKRSGCSPKRGDVLIAKDGATCLETVCVYEQSEAVILLSSIAILRPGPRLDGRFLKFYLEDPDTKHMLQEGFVSGSAIPRVVLKDFKRAPVPVPPLFEQKAIAHILGTLDDKIELNRRMNETLEGMARAIFKSWFVDFDPVRAKAAGRDPRLPKSIADLFPDSFVDSELGEIPEGWKVGKLGDVIAIHDSKRIPLSGRERAKRQGPYPYYGAASVMDYIDDYLFDGVYVLVGEDGSVINDDDTPVVQYVWGKFWVNNHAHVLTGQQGISVENLVMFFRQLNIRPFVTGAVQPKLNQGNLTRIPFLIPPQNVTTAMNQLISSIFAKYRATTEESRSLAAVRDALLPKLISGEVRVPDAEKFMERMS